MVFVCGFQNCMVFLRNDFRFWRRFWSPRGPWTARGTGNGRKRIRRIPPSNEPPSNEHVRSFWAHWRLLRKPTYPELQLPMHEFGRSLLHLWSRQGPHDEEPRNLQQGIQIDGCRSFVLFMGIDDRNLGWRVLHVADAKNSEQERTRWGAEHGVSVTSEFHKFQNSYPCANTWPFFLLLHLLYYYAFFNFWKTNVIFTLENQSTPLPFPQKKCLPVNCRWFVKIFKPTRFSQTFWLNKQTLAQACAFHITCPHIHNCPIDAVKIICILFILTIHVFAKFWIC